MPLSEILPTVSQLSHQDKLRLIHFLLLAIAQEEGLALDPAENSTVNTSLLHQLAFDESLTSLLPEIQTDLADEPTSQQIQADLEKAQAIFRRYIPATRRLSEELIQERREEALRE